MNGRRFPMKWLESMHKWYVKDKRKRSAEESNEDGITYYVRQLLVYYCILPLPTTTHS